jgi:uncharacterized protein (DUF342 family)
MSDTDRDGTYDLYYRDGWLCLRVYEHDGAGRPVYYEDIQNRIKVMGAPAVASSRVREVVERATGNETRLVEWPGGQQLAATVGVVVAADAMSATMRVSRPRKGAAPPDEDDLRRAIGAAGVVEGIDDETVASIIADHRYNEPVVVARGRAPVHARSSRIVYHFDVNRGKPYLVMEFDRINLRELKFIEFKEKGELLAEVEPPVPAVAGVTVLGQSVPASGDPIVAQLRAGPGTELDREGRKLYATEEGNVKLEGEVAVIEPVVTVERVDYATGNIHFDGSVVVTKDVADGFIIEAGGDVQIAEGVGRATIRAGGSVLLQAGINGGGEGVIEARGNVLAKYVEGAQTHCHGNLIVEEAIMHSSITVWGNCALTGKRAEIIASNVIVGRSLWCKKLGSVSEAPLTISAGVDPTALFAYRDKRGGLAEAEERLDTLRDQLSKVEKALVDGRTDERLFDAREQFARQIAELGEGLPELRREVRELRDGIEASRKSRIIVEDTIFKGVVVQFGAQEYRAPEQGARKTILRRGVDGVEEDGFNPADPPPFRFDEAGNAQGGASDAGDADDTERADPTVSPESAPESE